MSPPLDGGARPRLARGVRLRQDRLTGKFLLLRPETGFELRGSALDIVRLCDGTSTVSSIVDQLAKNYGETARSQIAEDVARLLDELLARRLIAVREDGQDQVEGGVQSGRSAP
ncbi:MAG TPA: pyrroloquinoline quinone biosynthesis peptide chaperone PqqD [Polyangia bacterium]